MGSTKDHREHFCGNYEKRHKQEKATRKRKSRVEGKAVHEKWGEKGQREKRAQRAIPRTRECLLRTFQSPPPHPPLTKI